MNRKSPLVCLSLAAWLLLAPQGSARAQDRAELELPRKELLVDAEKIYLERQATIKKLLAAMDEYRDDKSWSGPFNQAIGGLGNLRAKEGIKQLARSISFFPFREFTDPRYPTSPSSYPTEIFYPSVAALCEIGEPSDLKKELLQLLGGSDDELQRALTCWVLMESYGKDAALEIVVVRAKNSDDPNKPRYDWCVDYIKNYEASFGLPSGSPAPNGHIGGSLQRVLARRLAAAQKTAPAQTK